MNPYPMLTNYVSEIDQCLQQFDKAHPNLSKSQQKEQAKYRRIYQLRDTAVSSAEIPTFWKGF